MQFDDRPEYAKRLEQARTHRGFSSAKEAARFFGWPYDTYAQHENGTRGISRVSDRYAKAFRVSEAWLLTGSGEGPGGAIETTVPVMGYIGAGAVIEPDFEQVPQEGLSTVDVPFAIPDGIIALEVKGDSMLPRYDDGDVVLVYAEQQRSTQSLLGEEVAVRTAKGRRYLKRLMRGSGGNGFNLESWNAKTIESVSLEWVGEIYLTVRSGQLRRIEAKERAAVARRNSKRAAETEGMDELPLIVGRSG
jgi:SOS-response transcriptional repressor LexA